MNSYYQNYSGDIYSPAIMTPPPDDVDCNLDAHPPKQIPMFMPAFREPPTPESLPRMTVLTTPHRRQSSVNNNYPRRHSTTASDSIFSPREPQDLLREREYIGEELEKQSGLKRQLIRRYSSAEDDFNSSLASNKKQRRRLRKQLSKLKGQLSETGNSERVLAIRFSELCLELKSHETWAQAHWERQRYVTSPVEYFDFSPLSMFREVPRQETTAQNNPLDATSPVFIPRGLSVDEIMAGSSESNLETVEETSEECFKPCNQGFEDNDDNREEEDDSLTSSYRRSSLDEEVFSPKEKRLSLPDLHSLWL